MRNCTFNRKNGSSNGSARKHVLKQGVLVLLELIIIGVIVQIAPRLSPWVEVVGTSMEPNLNNGEIWHVRHKVPQKLTRGTVVLIFHWNSMATVKRVIGLPGETVTFVYGEVFINGQMLREPYIKPEQVTFCWERQELKAESDQYIVLGDNRDVSQDSREEGAVDWTSIIGVVDVQSSAPRLCQQPHYRLLSRCNSQAPQAY